MVENAVVDIMFSKLHPDAHVMQAPKQFAEFPPHKKKVVMYMAGWVVKRFGIDVEKQSREYGEFEQLLPYLQTTAELAQANSRLHTEKVDKNQYAQKPDTPNDTATENHNSEGAAGVSNPPSTATPVSKGLVYASEPMYNLMEHIQKIYQVLVTMASLH
jgi:hypothetical protein